MRVLLLNQSDRIGGAGIAAYRLHQGLLAKGIDSRFLVGKLKARSDRVELVPQKRRLTKWLSFLTEPLSLKHINNIGTFKISKHPFYEGADVVNFHNLHSGTGYFNYLALPALTKNKPAVLTLHDMWTFTGHCAYSLDCDRWKRGCGQCPYPETYPAIERDNTRLEWQLKNWVYDRSNLTIVTPSRWLAEEAKQSMLARFPIHHVPNGLDTNAYQPIERERCRLELGIPKGKKVLMFGCKNIQNSRKGVDLLFASLSMLPESVKAETLLLTFGRGGEEVQQAVSLETLNLGYLESDRAKSVAYCAADLFVFPTRADNLPVVLQESMACGTPMVSFDIGGVAEMVRPGVTGYLAPPEDVKEFANGIVELLADKNLRERMSQQCRAIAVREYSLELQVQRYMELYQQALQGAAA
ncbi:MAG: glycosyltransferase [Oscillatoria sp. SIO1A7]|nr:glycosyltransferase [Oscillatoria sp. SIO1A7]